MSLDFWHGSIEAYQKIGAKTDSSIDALGLLKIFHDCLQQGTGHITKTNFNGTVRKEAAYYIEKIAELGGRLLIKDLMIGYSSHVFFWEKSIAELDLHDTGEFAFAMISDNEKLVNQISEIIKADIVPPSKKGYIFAIMRYGSNLQMQSIGFAGTPLEKENYSPKIIEDYNYIIKDLKSSQPSGRIAIFDGAPGCGKTFILRSILLDVPNAMFVLVPPAMVSSLGGPELLPMLLQHRQSYAKSGPTIFLLEDADSCLAPRASDNMDSITSILNIGDGIFGSLFDIRIIATTNAKQQDMDNAIIRAGRLSKRVSVGRLQYEDANRIFNRLLPGKFCDLPKNIVDEGPSMKPRVKTNDWSLAEVYRSARDYGWEPTAIEEPESGFDVKSTDPVGYYGDDDDE